MVCHVSTVCSVLSPGTITACVQEPPLVYPSTHWRLGKWFPVSPVVNEVSLNIYAEVSVDLCFHFLGVQLWGHMPGRFLPLDIWKFKSNFQIRAKRKWEENVVTSKTILFPYCDESKLLDKPACIPALDTSGFWKSWQTRSLTPLPQRAINCKTPRTSTFTNRKH